MRSGVLRGENNIMVFWVIIQTLKMEEVNFFDSLVATYETTRWHNLVGYSFNSRVVTCFVSEQLL